MDSHSFNQIAVSEVPRLLEEWTGLPARVVSDGPLPEADGARDEVDAVLEWAGERLLVAMKSGARAAQVESAIRHLQYAAGRPQDTYKGLLLVVPFMGAVGERHCKQAGLSWLDLSGNAEIRLGPIRVHRRGQPNRFASRRGSRGPFSTKASRIPRLLLRDPSRWWRQEELIDQTGLSRGYVSDVAAELQEMGLVLRDEHRKLRPHDPGVLLDDWWEEYAPLEGIPVIGYVAARSGEALMNMMAAKLEAASLTYAITALGAAWLLAPMARFRKLHVYVRGRPEDRLLEDVGFRKGEKGANLQVIVGPDDAVWKDATEVGGMKCVSALQTYLDLKNGPERSTEAAKHLRDRHLLWPRQ